MEKKVLGRGLSALIPERAVNIAESRSSQGIINISIDKIRTNKYQPREDFDPETIKELSVSIKEKGFIQPVIIRATEEGDYELISGERRLRAAKMLNLEEVPAIVKTVSDQDSLEISIIENVQREDLNPIDQANAYKRLSDEFNMTQENIAGTIGKDRATITNILRLLKLPKKIQDLVSRGTITMGHAKAILSLDNESEQLKMCEKIIKKDLSVRDVERYVRNIDISLKKKISEDDPNLISIEEDLREHFGTKVKIIKGKKGGKIEIMFYTAKDLERIVTLLK